VAKRTAYVPEQTLMVFDPMKRRIRKNDIKFLNKIEIGDVQPEEIQIVSFLVQCRLNHSFGSVDPDHFALWKKACYLGSDDAVTAAEIKNTFRPIQIKLSYEPGSPFLLMVGSLLVFFPVEFVCHLSPASFGNLLCIEIFQNFLC